LLAAFSNELPAQTTTSGALIGVVTDASKAVVPDAVVEISDVAKGTVQTAKTDREGVYRFFFLPPGRYILTATHDGIQEETRTVTILLGPPVSLNISLGIMKASTTVQVSGEAPLLNTENGDVSTTNEPAADF
jgi:Carboxypeptidase regulatory-like domain